MDNYNISSNYRMSRSELYQQAKIQAQELGIPLADLKSRWRGSSTEDWREQNKVYSRDIKNRKNNYNRALRVARELREELSLPNRLSGSSNQDWKRELRRLRMRGRRGQEQRATQLREKVQPILREVQSTNTLGVKRTEKRTKKIKEDLNTYITKQLIRKNDFQRIFNRVINQNITLTDSQAQVVWNNIQGIGPSNVLITGYGISQDLPLNRITRNFFMNILKNGKIVIDDLAEEEGSDTLKNINIAEIDSIKYRILKADRFIKNRDGRFFTKINTTEIDLSKYQIYNQNQAYDEDIYKKREHCLIHTLQEQGISKAILNSIKLSYITGFNIRKKDLPFICEQIKRNINVYTKNGNRIAIQNIKCSTPTDQSVEIAMYENHYFTYEITKYSSYSIIHYDELKNCEDFHDIIKKKTTKGRYHYYTRAQGKSKINSLLLVDKLSQSGKFKKLDLIRFEESSNNIETRDHIYLDNIECEQTNDNIRIEQTTKQESDGKDHFYADCESFVNGNNHELYLLGYVGHENDYVDILSVEDSRYKNKIELLIRKWLNDMTRGGTEDAFCFFHNLKYDYHLLEKYLNIFSRCEKDGQLYSVTIKFKGKKITLKDSYKLIPFPLSKFGEVFNLPKAFRKKEAIAYTYYTRSNDNIRIKTKKYKSMLSREDQKIFKEVIKLEPSYNPKNNSFNPTTYYKDYLKLDCLVLKYGIQKMELLIREITSELCSVYGSLTISSLTDNYMYQQGVYNGICYIKGNLRTYVDKAVYGGRVCVNPKYKKQTIEGKISDYDGVSLYPSAINRLTRESGLPRGQARRFDTTNPINTWNEKTYSILTVKITKVKKYQQMPFIAYKKKGEIDYINTPPPEPVIIDSITLQDYINFHDIEYELLDGVYWNNGVNKKMGEVIQTLFETRLKFKKSNPALANTIKLMLNSSYGKTIMKKTKTEKNIVKTHQYKKIDNKWEKSEKTNLNNYILSNFNTIKSIRKLNEECYEIEQIKYDESWNRGHIGCAILSTSKRIMNEVFDIANENSYPIYYTDTDSLHCNTSDVSKLEAKYFERYQKKLNGSNLEQFHTDFDMKGAEGEIYATKSIFLGKKSYMDVLESTNVHGDIITGFHIRLKGITKEGLEHEAKKYNNSYLGLYEDLSQGNSKNILMNPFNQDDNKQKVMFDFKQGKVSTRREFYRTVRF